MTRVTLSGDSATTKVLIVLPGRFGWVGSHELGIV
jgi:hypothetical protein